MCRTAVFYHQFFYRVGIGYAAVNIPRVFNAVRAAGSGSLLCTVSRQEIFISRFNELYASKYRVVFIERNVYAFRQTLVMRSVIRVGGNFNLVRLITGRIELPVAVYR